MFKLVAIMIAAFVTGFVLTIAFLNLIAWLFGQVFAGIVAWVMLIVCVVAWCVYLAAAQHNENEMTDDTREYIRRASGM